jgi:plasmid stability protein
VAAITIRNLSDETHRALRHRAAANGRSTEAEVRAILDAAARPDERLRLGSALVTLFHGAGSAELDVTREQSPAEPALFE